MGEVYSLTTTVYIWTGEGTPGSDEAINYLSTAGFQQYMGTMDSFRYGRAARWEIAFKMFTRNERCLVRHLRTHATFTRNLSLLHLSMALA